MFRYLTKEAKCAQTLLLVIFGNILPHQTDLADFINGFLLTYFV